MGRKAGEPRRARTKRRPRGRPIQMARPPSALSTPSATKAHRQDECAATIAAAILPQKPPSTVPVTYAATAAPAPVSHSSLI